MPCTSSVRSINRSPTHSSNPVHVPTSDPQNQPFPSPQNPTTSLTPSFSNSLELFSPTPTKSTSKDKWPSLPPLPQRSPHIRRWRNDTSLVSTNRNSEACSSVGAPPPNTSTSDNSGAVQEPASLTNGEPTASSRRSTQTHPSSYVRDKKVLPKT